MHARFLLLGILTSLVFPIGSVAEDPAVGTKEPIASSTIPANSGQSPVLDTFDAADGRYHFTLDATAAPDLMAWAQTELKPVVQAWYPKLVAMLASDHFAPATNITLRFRNDMRGTPASAGGGRINMNSEWFRKELNREARGSMVHVVQNYGQARRANPEATRTPGWLVEGLADYIRWFLYEPETRGAEITARNLSRAKYDASYRITGNFLDWVVEHYDKDIVRKLNAAAREGKYSEQLWQDETHRTLQDLGQEWKQAQESRLHAAVSTPAATPTASPAAAPEIQWQHLSSQHGDLPVPGPSTQQTGALVADLDKNGVNDFVLSFRKVAPALVWYKRTETGWDRIVLEPSFLTVEAGGAAADIDGDGDLDLVFGGDWQSNEVWWWENPYPNYSPAVGWKRHLVKQGGKSQHHDQVFGDFTGSGKPQLAFWNQQAKMMFLAPIPPQPRETEPWSIVPIFYGSAGETGDKGSFLYAEGASAADVDGDGKIDLLAGNYWFKHVAGTNFTPVKIGPVGGLIFAGRFKPGPYLQVVISPGDGVGPLRWYECVGDPTQGSAWEGHDLVGRDLIHGHSLQLGDINGDGHLDIFAAEMAKWTESRTDPDNPKATSWIFFGNGQGHFRTTVLTTGQGWHEARLADLDGDGDLDLLNKPYNWEAPRIDVWLNNGTAKKRVTN